MQSVHRHCQDVFLNRIPSTNVRNQSPTPTIGWYLYENKRHWQQFESAAVVSVVVVVVAVVVLLLVEGAVLVLVVVVVLVQLLRLFLHEQIIHASVCNQSNAHP